MVSSKKKKLVKLQSVAILKFNYYYPYLYSFINTRIIELILEN